MTITLPTTSITHTPIVAKQPVLKVIGLGGGGQNTVDRMIELGLSGIDFIAANTDAQVLQKSLAPVKIQLGPILTRGLGAGGDPVIGEASAEESLAELSAALSGADMVFLTAGMGGGTGTGAIPVAAKVAKSVGAVVVAVVSLPFSFEVGHRQKNARDGINKLKQYTDTMISIPNDRLLQFAPRDLPLELAFRLADDVLRQGVQGISELITQPGLINVDFSHIRALMKNGGGSLLAIGTGEGPNKTEEALERALHHPMLETIDLNDATGIIANFTGGKDLAFMDVMESLNHLQRMASPNATLIPGVVTDERMEDRVQLILVLTGIGATSVDSSEKAQEVEESPEQENGQPIALDTAANSNPVQPFMAGSPSSLDIPAFLRRRLK
jgi:cell division protein FtsZ